MIFGIQTKVSKEEMFIINNQEEVIIDSLFSQLSHNLKDYLKYNTNQGSDYPYENYTTYEVRCWVEEMDTLKNKLKVIYELVDNPILYDKIRNILLDKQKITDISGDIDEFSNSW